MGTLLQIDDDRNLNNGVNQAKAGKSPINHVLVKRRRPMIEDSDEEDDLGRAIANPGGRGVRRNAHQHNHGAMMSIN